MQNHHFEIADRPVFSGAFSAPVPEGDEERYALIKSGPEVRPEEVESLETTAAEVMLLWGSNVLHVAHLSPPRSFSVGESDAAGAAVDYLVPESALGTPRLPLLLVDASGPRLVIPGGASGHLELANGERSSLDAARARGTHSLGLANAVEVPITKGMRARLEISGFVFQVSLVHGGRKVKRGLLASPDWNTAGFFGASFMAVGALMAAMAFFVPPLNLLGEEELERERLYLINAILKSQAEREREQTDAPEKSDQNSDEGGTGERAAGDEGSMGKATSRASNKRFAVRKTLDESDPHLARLHGLEEATSFGMVAILSGADADAPTSPFGRDTASGLDDVSAQGAMWGDTIGESYGAGGLGLTGLGEGAGGSGVGVGLGNIGLGHDAGLALAQGFGNGLGRMNGTHKAKADPVRLGKSEVSGRLPPEVIQRIVRQNYGRFRMCYEQGLTKNPNLAGRVGVRFVIGREGDVQNAQNGGSDLPDSAVVGCVVSAFYGVTFPKPENGVVTVSYPIMFSPG